MLDEALAEGGWFGYAHEQRSCRPPGTADVDERVTAVRTLVAEETRVGMFVGVAVGFGLARELAETSSTKEDP